MRLNRSRVSWQEIVLAIVAIGIFALVLFAVCRDQAARDACRKHGGRVEEYDCRDEIHCTTTPDGDGGSHTSCYTTRSCSWRCVDLPAEAPR